MKVQVTNYTFDKTTKRVVFTDYTSIRLDSILLITNVTDNIIIYNFASSLLGGVVTGNYITLTYDTSLMDNSDSLQIFYEDSSVQPPTENTLSNLDNTSFWLKSLIRLLKPLSVVTGGGSNRLSVDVNAVTGAVGTVTTVTTVTTVASATNQVNMGNVAGYTMQQSLLRNAFANGIRKNLV